jgi:hypothetical protein
MSSVLNPKSLQMRELDEPTTRTQAALADAERHGYLLTVEEAPNMPAPITHMARAVSRNAGIANTLPATAARSPTRRRRAEIIRRHVELDEVA